jgi:hypothetical protein
VFKWIGFDATNLSMLFGYVLIPIFVFLGIRYFRNDINGGELSFGHGMSIGFLIYTMIAIIAGLGIWLILSFSPEFFQEIKAAKIAVMDTNKDLIVGQLGQESFDITFEKILAMKAVDVALNDFIWKILPGLFFTIIISIILRRTKF